MEILASLALLYLILAPRVAMPLYNSMLFYPVKYPEGLYDLQEIDGAAIEDIEVRSRNGRKLHGWLIERSGADIVVVVSHGNAGNLSYRQELCSMVLRAGASVLVYDYQGYGRSEGCPSLAGICDDGLAFHDWLVEEANRPPETIVHLGESLGSGVACHVSESRECGGLILQSAFSSLASIARAVMPYLMLYPRLLMPEPALDNLGYLERDHPPTLLVHGMKDEIIPHAHSQRLFNLASGQKQLLLLPDAGHNDIYQVNSNLYIKGMEGFLDTIRGTTTNNRTNS